MPGYSLLDFSSSTKRDALAGYEALSQQEQQRNRINEQIETAEKNQKLSSTSSGAILGGFIAKGTALGGPWGAALGAAVGYLATEVF